MKKSIHFLVIALLTTSSIVAASNIKTEATELDAAINFKKSEDKGTKFVSYADANLVENEIASLKKHSKTVEEIITEDNSIIESVVADTPKTISTKKTLKRKRIIRN